MRLQPAAAVERKRKYCDMVVEEDERDEEKSEDGEDELDIDEVYELLGVESGSHSSQFGVPRKRERLTNLTPEEKLNRRKMKNRVAAQTARDRKKERSQKLEEIVKHLLEETKKLRAENQSLRRENQRILQQQQPLNKKPVSSFEVSSSEVELSGGGGGVMEGCESKKTITSSSGVRKEAKREMMESGVFGSAEFINEPLPWERIPNSSAKLLPTANTTTNNDMSCSPRHHSSASSRQKTRVVAKQLLRTLLCSMLTICAPATTPPTTSCQAPHAPTSMISLQRSMTYKQFLRTSSKGQTLPTSTNSATKLSKRRLLLQRCLAALMQRRSRRRIHFSSSETSDQHWESSQEDVENHCRPV